MRFYVCAEQFDERPYNESMDDAAKLLTFESIHNGDVLNIHLNEAGATELIQVLNQLLVSKGNAHDHLMTPSWSGTELTEDRQEEISTLVNQVNVFLWRDQRSDHDQGQARAH